MTIKEAHLQLRVLAVRSSNTKFLHVYYKSPPSDDPEPLQTCDPF